jgi:hypothetical protein
MKDKDTKLLSEAYQRVSSEGVGTFLGNIGKSAGKVAKGLGDFGYQAGKAVASPVAGAMDALGIGRGRGRGGDTFDRWNTYQPQKAQDSPTLRSIFSKFKPPPKAKGPTPIPDYDELEKVDPKDVAAASDPLKTPHARDFDELEKVDPKDVAAADRARGIDPKTGLPFRPRVDGSPTPLSPHGQDFDELEKVDPKDVPGSAFAKDFDELETVDPKDVAGSAFARAALPEGHPLRIAYTKDAKAGMSQKELGDKYGAALDEYIKSKEPLTVPPIDFDTPPIKFDPNAPPAAPAPTVPTIPGGEISDYDELETVDPKDVPGSPGFTAADIKELEELQPTAGPPGIGTDVAADERELKQAEDDAMALGQPIETMAAAAGVPPTVNLPATASSTPTDDAAVNLPAPGPTPTEYPAAAFGFGNRFKIDTTENRKKVYDYAQESPQARAGVFDDYAAEIRKKDPSLNEHEVADLVDKLERDLEAEFRPLKPLEENQYISNTRLAHLRNKVRLRHPLTLTEQKILNSTRSRF